MTRKIDRKDNEKQREQKDAIVIELTRSKRRKKITST